MLPDNLTHAIQREEAEGSFKAKAGYPHTHAANEEYYCRRVEHSDAYNHEWRPEWFCPLSNNLMTHPVLGSDGNTYEKSSLDQLALQRPAATNFPTIARVEGGPYAGRICVN